MDNWTGAYAITEISHIQKNARRATKFKNLAHALTWTGACVYTDRRIDFYIKLCMDFCTDFTMAFTSTILM